MSTIETLPSSKCGGKEMAAKSSPWRSRSWWALRLGGAMALVWFLVRVIPKPSRATYPCQRAAFPVAAGFVVWLMGAFGSMVAIRKTRLHLREARWRTAAACLAIAVVAGSVVFINVPASEVYGQSQAPAQPTFSPTEPVNTPMGVAYGVKPGRVAWAFDPKATTWDGTTSAPAGGTTPTPIPRSSRRCWRTQSVR